MELLRPWKIRAKRLLHPPAIFPPFPLRHNPHRLLLLLPANRRGFHLGLPRQAVAKTEKPVGASRFGRVVRGLGRVGV